MTARIRPVNAATESEALAVCTDIRVDWLKVLQGELVGTITFESKRFLKDIASGSYFAADGSAVEPAMMHSIADAMAFSLPLDAPVSAITGEHVMAFIKAYYHVRYEEQPEVQP